MSRYCTPAIATLLILFASLSTILLRGAGQRTQARLSVKVGPTEWVVNQAGQLRFQVTLEEGKLLPGSRIGINFPGSWTWHAMHPIRKDGQWVTLLRVPTRELSSYFSVVSQETKSQWKFDVLEQDGEGYDHRFDREVVLTLESGQMTTGENLTLHYGTPQKPVHASRLAGVASLRVRFDPGDGTWQQVKNSPTVKTNPDRPEGLLVTATSQVRLHDAVRVHITARDHYGNVALLPNHLKVRTSDPEARITAVPAKDPGFRERLVHFAKPGFQTVEAGSNTTQYFRSNPILVTADIPALKLYWGDLHSHSAISRDAIGHDSFRFARDYANLDFFASTEHCTGAKGEDGVTDGEWREIQAMVKQFDQPARFVTLLAYECSCQRLTAITTSILRLMKHLSIGSTT